uniref:Uncharacterized protein n=1 Tax=Timema cristinae TaxID=61476 RepID=A0A7R9HAU6_TIMCR|nr:unnamed protein product [Timema cristinae]
MVLSSRVKTENVTLLKDHLIRRSPPSPRLNALVAVKGFTRKSPSYTITGTLWVPLLSGTALSLSLSWGSLRIAPEPWEGPVTEARVPLGPLPATGLCPRGFCGRATARGIARDNGDSMVKYLTNVTVISFPGCCVGDLIPVAEEVVPYFECWNKQPHKSSLSNALRDFDNLLSTIRYVNPEAYVSVSGVLARFPNIYERDKELLCDMLELNKRAGELNTLLERMCNARWVKFCNWWTDYQIICEESPCVFAPVNAAVASDLGSQKGSTRTPLVTICGGLEATSQPIFQ